MNPHLFRADGGALVDSSDIVASAVAAGDEGLTFIGGEPFDQAPAAAALARVASEQGLGVICFTGYEYETLVARSADARSLIEHIDLLVDGPYIADRAERSRPLVGSTNQRFIHLTERYRTSIESTRNRIEVRLAITGQVDVAGFTDAPGVASLQRTLGRRRRP